MKTFHNGARIVAAVCCLLLMGLMAIGNYSLVAEPVGQCLRGEATFVDMSAQIASGYLSNKLTYKDEFVNLNGLFARLTGKRLLNEILLMNNGMLASEKKSIPVEMTWFADRMLVLSDYLKKLDAHFIYSAIAYKSDMVDELLPAGWDTEVTKGRGDSLLQCLAERGVSYVDLRQEVASTADLVERYYYRTDHHWKPEGAFVAFQTIMNKMKEIDPELDLTVTDRSLWECHDKKDWFLGSYGRRVGMLFGGVDDLQWFTPRFETEMSCSVLKYHMIYKGDYEDANLRRMYIDGLNYFHANPYCVYIGGDYPLVLHRNANAPNRKRILLIKDSFTLPLQSFFASAFTEVDVLDPRHYTASSVAEYITWTQPDFVLMNTLVSLVMDNAYFKFGIEAAGQTYLNAQWTPVQTWEEMSITAADSPYQLSAVPVTLERGGTYRISFDDLELTEGTADGVSAVLFDWTDKKIVNETIYDIGYCHQFGGSAWTFKVPDDDHRYGLLLYAGPYADAAGNGIRYSGFRVEKKD